MTKTVHVTTEPTTEPGETDTDEFARLMNIAPGTSSDAPHPPSYNAAITLPPSYSEAVEPKETIVQEWTMPEKGQYPSAENAICMVVPRVTNGVMLWVPVVYADKATALQEAIMRLSYTSGFYVDEGIQWIQIGKECCTPRPKAFLIYDASTKVPLFYVEEESDACSRCCLKPGHAQKMNIFLVDAYTMPVRSIGPVWSMTREGTSCCTSPDFKCTKCPAACGCCGMFNCMDCTRDEYKMYLGHAYNLPHEEQQVPMIGRMQQQSCCASGWCGNPTLSLFNREEENPYAVVEASKIFGGWFSCCMDSEVTVSDIEHLKLQGKEKGCCGYPVHSGDVAIMKKLRPRNCIQCCREACTDADTFSLGFTSQTLSVEQRVSVLGSLIAMNSMLFESDMKPVQGDGNGGVICTLWECYCCGCILPCCIYLPNNR